MNDYSFFFDYPIQDNQLVCYWSGVNIYRISSKAPKTDYKEYYQFQSPLFLSNDSKKIKYNDDLLLGIGRCVGVEMHELLGSDEFMFLCFAKKPIESYIKRVGFQLRIKHHEIKDTFSKLSNFLIHELMISPVVLESIYHAANQIYSENHFSTFPISILGIGKKSENDLPYAQIYITNNPDTIEGSIHQIQKDQVIRNTSYIINALNLCMDVCTVNKLIDFAYTQNMYLSFCGIDVYIDRIIKFKLYFRFDKNLRTDEVLNIFSDKIKCLKTASVPYPEDIVDFIAFSFVPVEHREFVFDGVQIYQK